MIDRTIDSPDPRLEFDNYAMGEGRYTTTNLLGEEEAEQLIQEVKNVSQQRYKELAGRHRSSSAQKAE